MGLPSEPVTLTVGQIDELNKKLSSLRHDINNQLSLVTAASELLRFKPDQIEKWTNTLTTVPKKVQDKLQVFSTEFEQIFGITRP